ncbi:hypothetical protein [Fischerella thermalis]|uniref:hypothetical protein n=1 Tax=Fischerella thermalis TaxID=372787 RepID=UPI0015E086D6|nr:hypothetical protein [Fischerella thermalis]
MNFGFCEKFEPGLRALASPPKAIARLKAFQDGFWILDFKTDQPKDKSGGWKVLDL